MWYALYQDKVPTYDESGNPTWEDENGYSAPVEFRANLSAGNSNAEEEPFGNNVQYDRIILTHDMSLPIDEESLIWVKNKPVFNGFIVDPDSADYEVAAAPLDSLNVLLIAIRRRIGNHTQSKTDNEFDSESY